MAGSSQKFIARNRSPRVQIEYDVELYGAEKKVQLPFVMGVMSDLAGKSNVAQPAVADRKFLEIDVDNFDDRMKSMAPRAAFSVPNTLTGEGNLAVDLTFEKMADFSPGAIAAKIEPLRALLEARTQLANLMTYMDGKSGAEALIERILANPALLGALSGASPDAASPDAALESLRGVTVDEPEPDRSGEVLDALRRAEIQEEGADDGSAALESLRGVEVEETPAEDGSAALDSLRGITVDEAPAEDGSAALDTLRGVEIEETPAEDGATALESLRGVAVEEAASEDGSAVLDSLRGITVDETPAEDGSAALDSLRGVAVDEVPAEDGTAALDSLRGVEVEETTAGDGATALESLRGVPVEEAASEDGSAALDSLRAVAVDEPPAEDGSAALDSLRGVAVDEVPAEDGAGALASLRGVSVDETQADDGSAGLESLRGVVVEETLADDGSAALDSLKGIAVEEAASEDNTSALDSLRSVAAEEAPAEDGTAALDSLRLGDTEDTHVDDGSDTLDALRGVAVEETPAEDGSHALDSLRSVAVAEDAPEDDSAALDSLLGLDTGTAPADDGTSALETLRTAESPPVEAEPDGLDDLIGALGEPDAIATAAPDPVAEPDGLDDMVGDVGQPETAIATVASAAADGLDDLLGLENTSQPEQAVAAEPDGLDDLLGNLGDPAEPDAPTVETVGLDDVTSAAESAPAEADGLDDLFGDLGQPEPVPEPEPTVEAEPAGDAGDLDDLLGDLGAPEATPSPAPVAAVVQPAEDLDDLLGDLGEPETASDPEPVAATAAPPADDLDDLLGDLGEPETTPEPEPEPAAAAADDLDDLLGDLGAPEPAAEPAPAAADGGALDDLLGDLGGGAEAGGGAELMDLDFDFGVLSAERPDPQKLKRKRFRMAIFGDFSGRAARGILETGDKLAVRKPILLDPDTAEEVIEGFRTTLVLPVGKDGAGVEVKLKGLDAMHPDELYENVELFAELVGLKQQLGMGATAQTAAARLKEWSEKHGTYAAPARLRSGGNAVPADLRLTDFQRLIGDTGAKLAEASPVDELMARIVGPHIRAVPNADQKAMQKAVDESLSAAMRLVLHHPEFQSLEAQWRSIDLIARSVETDDTLDVILYDVSAEEIAADLASARDLAESGLVRLLTGEPLDEENGRGGYSALLGLYTFEETPPHAELLSLVARAAAHVDAPFFAAMSPAFMEVEKQDRHPLVARAWDDLRGMAEAKYLGLATPRFLLRRPYGEKTEPCYEFDFEEFTMAEGLSGMLWANPVVLVAILLARSFKQFGKSMQLGKVMSLGGMPYHFVEDRHGDQVALPCTERNLTLATVEKVMARGFMPVVSVKGRDEVRLASFQAMGGGEIRGPWTGEPPPPPTKPERKAMPKPQKAEAAAPADDLDALLAGFGDDVAAPSGDVDADLAALLDGL